MPLRVPPPEVPIVKWLSPNKADQGLLEFWNTEVASYVPLDIGAAHPNTRQYPGFTLGKQSPLQGDEKWVARIWVTPETSPEWFNYAEKFSAEDNAYPIFIRTYREPKSTYTPRAKQSSLGAFYKLVLDNPGSGYASGTLPEVTFDSVSPTPALAHGVVGPDGTLTECVLDFCGEGYTGNVAFTVDAPANGNPASGTAYVQPVTAILVKEEANQYPEDSEFYAQYLQVIRIYETLPGPFLISTKLDVDGAIVNVRTRRNLCSDITTGEDIDAGFWAKVTKHQTDSDFVCEEVQEVRPIPGNVMESTKIDEDGKVITRTQQYVDSTTIVSSETIVAGEWIKKFEEEVDGTDLVSWQIVESRPVPGNPIPYTRIDDDGKVVTGTRTLKDESTITTVESLSAGVWTHTNKERVTDLVSWQVTETRPIPGNAMESDRLDDDGVKVAVVQTMESAATIAAITPRETLSGGIWTKITSKEISDLVAWKIVETRAVPGNEMVSTKVDDDGKVITLTKTLSDTSAITSQEQITGGNWVRTYKEVVSDLVANKVVESRPIPGNPVPSTRLDDDGKPVTLVTTLKDTTTITTQETVAAGVWTKTTKKEVSDLVAQEIVEARAVPGNTVPSASVDNDHEIATISRLLRDESLITPSATESGGNITTVEKKEVSDLVANQITTVVKFLDRATYSVRIPESIIPLEFRANIPTTTEVHVVAGTAAMPSLAAGEFYREEKQLTRLLKAVTVESLGGISFPVVQHGQETSSEYGGAVLDVERTLDDSALTADEGEDIVSSVMNPIGDALMWFKETKKRPSTDAEWPTIPSDYFDKEMQVKALVEEQVVGPGYTETTGTYFVETLKGLDKWKSRRTKLTREPTAVDLASALIEEVDGPFQFPGLVFLAPGGGGYYRRQASAQLCQHTLRTWWLHKTTFPTRGLPGSGADVEVQDIIMDDIVISELNDVTRLAYSGMCLHDAITTFGVFVYAATEPSYTAYAALIGTEIVVAASIEPTDIPELWKIQTKSVVAR